MLTRLKKYFCLIAVVALASCGQAQAEPATPPQIPVLAYHSVMPAEFYDEINAANPWIFHLDSFRAHMQYLYDNDFNTLSSDQVLAFLDGDFAALPPNPIVLTFDDGYLDNALFVAPILREFGFTAMMFVLTHNIPDEPPVMTARHTRLGRTHMLETADVFEFGSHTHNLHHSVDGVGAMRVATADEIRADLRQSFEAPLTLFTGFAYPGGGYSDYIIDALAHEGILFAFITYVDYFRYDTHPFKIPRFSITADYYWDDIGFFSDVVNGRWER